MEKWEQDLKKFTPEHQNDVAEVWTKLEHNLKREDNRKRRNSIMQRTWIAGVAAFALVIAAVFFFSLDTRAPETATETPEQNTGLNGNEETETPPAEGEPGYFAAEIEKLNETYPEQQDVPLEIEGTTEQIPMVRVVPGNLAYLFYADEERYELSFDVTENDETPTFVTARDQLLDRYPSVEMKIETFSQKQPTQVVSEQTALLEEKFLGAEIEATQVSEPFAAYKLHAREGDEPSSEVITIYVLEEQHEEDTIVVTQSVFLEAQEGHGARFHAMLATLEVLN